MADPVKEKLRKQITETKNEIMKRYAKIRVISDPTEKIKAMDDFMQWRRLKYVKLFAEFEKWVWSD
jgi:hypothetical protein